MGKRGLRKGQNTWTKNYIKGFCRGYHGEFSVEKELRKVRKHG